MKTFNTVFFTIAAILLAFVPTNKTEIFPFIVERLIGYGILWMYYNHVQGQLILSEQKDAEIKRLSEEQEELLKKIDSLEND